MWHGLGGYGAILDCFGCSTLKLFCTRIKSTVSWSPYLRSMLTFTLRTLVNMALQFMHNGYTHSSHQSHTR